ncbi:MAG: transcription termination factor NusA [Bacilli bacterium]|nr:transcription termination factor NusA [Bacilli bacterium]
MDSDAFIKAVKNIVEEKHISEDIIYEAMELALASAYKKNFNALTNVKIDINRETGEIKVYSYKTVVDDVTNPEMELSLTEAKKIDKLKEIGDVILNEVTPKDFGRVAAGTAKQVIIQKIREAERNSVMEEFKEKEEELVVGLVEREDANNYYINLGRAHGILPKEEIIPGEEIKMGSNLKVYISKIEKTPRGLLLLLSRRHYGFLKRLLEKEIPELEEGIVLLYSVAREAGERSKVAVYSEQYNVDAVGACIGNRGDRINRIMEELNGERIDIIRYDKEPDIFIANALSPAKNLKILIADPKKQEAMVIADSDNLSLAIGRKGQNVRLAARLTHYRLDIKTIEEAREIGINFKEE